MKAYKIFVIFFVLGVVTFVYATANNAQTTNPANNQTDNKKSCCLKKADNTESCHADGERCSDEDCCKDGERKMNGERCNNGSCCTGGSCCKAKKADSAEQKAEKDSSCANGSACCSGGSCYKAKGKAK